ncbi:MAG TPA: PD-(D/E)XK nuclease family protein [Candidatus Pacearchaeota archaeon]|nr:PD-(D/E)XK nuclease family protein [Candidatus Pacearchaeota archaeon]HQF83159.1 PD-(D/E)XK nuclease family protein [Candidatus Pacearchaeota archaeon]HQI57490.1 PD-(D/E)XK nuclease family protein [Candidatus Pacearchaeota archaeon]HQJ57539.1 PD-(D/E)XK nuclease family protein [Candidatus Pacearchaeota archaeon]
MIVYSHSRLSTFEQCPLKYKLRYIDKIKPEIEKTIEAHLGSSVHDTLEWIYNSVKENSEKSPTLDEIINHYIKIWKKDLTQNILIVKKQLTQADYFNKGIQFLADYYQEYYPFKDGTIECEKEITIKLDENTQIKGFIDRLVYDLENNRYEIHDYKTAGTLPSQEKMDQDRQLALYSIAIKELYGQDKEVLLVWHYLAYNHKIISKRTREQLENLKEETKNLIKDIQNTKVFLPNKSILCEWCEYKSICPEWNFEIQEKVSEKILSKRINPFPEFKEDKEREKMDIWD